jgi:hypothetical protein
VRSSVHWQAPGFYRPPRDCNPAEQAWNLADFLHILEEEIPLVTHFGISPLKRLSVWSSTALSLSRESLKSQ